VTTLLTSLEADALVAVDEAAIASTLLELLAIPSITGSAAESEPQHILARRLDPLRLEVDLWAMDLPTLRADPEFAGTEVPRDQAWGLAAVTLGIGDGPTLTLQGHVDVVSPGDTAQWRGDPFVPMVTGDVVHARGACDMKAGLVANLAALAEIRDSGAKFRCRIAAHFTVSEEDGGLGAFATLHRGHIGDAWIITETTSSALVIANAGALTSRIEIGGKRPTPALVMREPARSTLTYRSTRPSPAWERCRNIASDPLMTDRAIPYAFSAGRLSSGDWASSGPACSWPRAGWV
jgi:acetylornithine deacetylase